MSNFADMAYDNYLMHYRTKGSKNGYTKDPDYTPVGERARVEREKAARRNEINMRSAQARRGDYTGMPSSAREAKESMKKASEINRLRMQRFRSDYAGMPSSALEAKENAKIERREEAKARYQKLNRPIEINKLSNQASRGDYAGMPSSALKAQTEAKARSNRLNMQRQAEAKRKAEYMKAKAEAKRKKESEINRLSEQASRGDYSGMPSSARSGNAYVKNRLAFKEWARKEREKDAREKALRNLQIDKLSRQKSKGDYAGMPSSAREAKEKVIRDKAWGIGFEAQRKYEKIMEEKKEEAKRKKNPKAYAGGKRLMMPK